MRTAIDRARRTVKQARRRHDHAVPPTAEGHINLCPICKLIDQTVPELASMVEEAARLLRELEHSRYAYECDLPGCPVCSAFEHEPHTDWCSLGRWLEGVR